MLTHKKCMGFEFLLRAAYVGTHFCGYEAEEEDTETCRFRMLDCKICGVKFPATHIRIYMDMNLPEMPELMQTYDIEELDKKHSEN